MNLRKVERRMIIIIIDAFVGNSPFVNHYIHDVRETIQGILILEELAGRHFQYAHRLLLIVRQNFHFHLILRLADVTGVSLHHDRILVREDKETITISELYAVSQVFCKIKVPCLHAV